MHIVPTWGLCETKFEEWERSDGVEGCGVGARPTSERRIPTTRSTEPASTEDRRRASGAQGLTECPHRRAEQHQVLEKELSGHPR